MCVCARVELCQCELQMWVRQVGCDQGSCDVGAAMCLRACVFVGVCVCDEDVSRMLFDVYF